MADSPSLTSMKEIEEASSSALSKPRSQQREDLHLLRRPINGEGGGGYADDDTDDFQVWAHETPRDRVVNHLALALGGLIVLLSLASVIGGGELLHSLKLLGGSCSLLTGVGAGSLSIGLVMLMVVALGAWKLHFGGELSRYGACCYPTQQPLSTKARRVVITGVLPLCVALLMLALAIGSIWLYTLSTTVPSLTLDYKTVAGINGPVTISRDSSGLTHIVAQSRSDALFGQGFAQAQDRLWQLEFQRLAGLGRLAEFVGAPGLKTDKQTRTLNLRNASATLCASATPEQISLMQAFVDGINFYLSQVNERPPEFMFMSKRLLFFHEPEPFTVLDVCLAARLLQWQLSFNVNLEIERFKMFWRTNRSYREVDEMYINQTNISHTILSPEQLNLTEADAVAARSREALDGTIEQELYDTYMAELRAKYADEYPGSSSGSGGADGARAGGGNHGDSGAARETAAVDWYDFLNWKQVHASNAWAARGAGGNASHACGASDPHLHINLPSVWYYSHLTYPGADNVTFDTSGVGMTGVPGCHIGKTTHVSWGITMSLTDLEDLFLLVPDPAAPDTNYLVNGESLSFQLREEVIQVKGGDAVTIVVQDSVYGPVASEVLGLPSVLKFAVWAQPLLPDNTSLTGVLNLGDPDRVRTVRDLRDLGFAQLRSPGFSIPMEDELGNLGYTMTGQHVVRHVGHTGKYPTLGNGSFDHVREIPFVELPTLILNSSSSGGGGADATAPHFIAAANQKIYPDGYLYTLGYDYVYPWRGGRIQALLSNHTESLSSLPFHREVQTDVMSNVWNQVLPLLQASPVFTSTLDAAGSQWFQWLASSWDGRSTIGSPYPSMFFLWLRELCYVPQDVLAALGYPQWSPATTYPIKLLSSPTELMERQCAARTTPLGGSCAVLAAQTFNAVAAQYYPSSSAAPQWGTDLNVLVGQHLMMHGTILACLFERSMAKDGDFSSIDVSDFSVSFQGSMAPTSASSMRQLYDWSTPWNVSFVFPGGDSGNPYSWRYQNLWDVFQQDEYVQVVVEGPLPDSEAVSKQKLSP